MLTDNKKKNNNKKKNESFSLGDTHTQKPSSSNTHPTKKSKTMPGCTKQRRPKKGRERRNVSLPVESERRNCVRTSLPPLRQWRFQTILSIKQKILSRLLFYLFSTLACFLWSSAFFTFSSLVFFFSTSHPRHSDDNRLVPSSDFASPLVFF